MHISVGILTQGYQRPLGNLIIQLHRRFGSYKGYLSIN
jgi:hypothetical protein